MPVNDGNFSVGDLVYLPCPEKPEHKDLAFLPGTVREVAADGQLVVDLVAGGVLRQAAGEARARFVKDVNQSTSQDNTSLVHLNDATILENLEARHERDEIYTYTASVLLAMNPYKDISELYGDSQCTRYRGKHIGALPPHPYAIADTAYRALVRERRNQGLLISGESGAGKTETAKIVMQYLGFASGATSDLAAKIQARVLQAQPILESLGNSVTMRNSNSSRFGKYNRVFFDEAGTLVDAGITTYLLESSRVVVHSSRERTYHCFYEMLSGLPQEKLDEFQLKRGQKYRLLSSSGGEEESWGQQFHDRDVQNFTRLCDSLRTIGLSEADVDDCFKVLAGLVHLGDLASAASEEAEAAAASEDSSKTVELDDESLEAAAKMLGMDSSELGAVLKRRKLCVPGRNSFHEVPRTAAQFRQALHSLIKALYKRLFDRTVARINASFKELQAQGADSADHPEWRHIGILDIYGFERLQRNSFEQLCINLANERLQQYFVENVLVAEQSLYKREGLPWMGLNLPDAAPVVNTISKIFLQLDELSQQFATGMEKVATDERFCQRTIEDASKDPQRKEVLKQLKMSNKRGSSANLALNEGFTIRHYAGQVEYTTKGWLDKNNDRLLPECEELICDSKNEFVKSLGDTDKNKVPFRSISKKYQADLETLLQTLSTCNLHYIRCFKPNEIQKPNIFNQRLVLDQIVQCGTIELVKIMHDGYPNRCPFEEITTRFQALLPESFQRYGMRTFIEALMLAYEVPKEEWALGMSRLFLKAGQLKALEDMRADGAAPDPEKLKLIVSGIIRKKWVRAGNAVKLCNFLPKFIAEVYATRAARALALHALVIARLQPKLEAARQRVFERRQAARRRLKAAFFSVRLVNAEMAQVHAKRRQRLVDALFLAARMNKRLQPWVAGAKERASESEKRREAERRREEERQVEARKQIEDERKRVEEERVQMEADMVAHKAKMEEEKLQREEEEAAKKLQEEKRREQEEAEWQAKEKQKVDEERQHLEEERKAFEEQKKLFEQERRTSVVLQNCPSPSRAKAPIVEAEEDDDVPDSASALNAQQFGQQGQSPMDSEIQKQMDDRIKALERDMARKQEEVLEQMRILQEKNANLEARLTEERAVSSAAGTPTPGDRRRDASPIPLDEDEELSPPATPPAGSAARKAVAGRQSLAAGSVSRSGRRFSLVQGLSGADSGRRLSITSKAGGVKNRRGSAAHEALRLEGQEGSRLGDAPPMASAQDSTIHSQRKWWAEQRQFLLEDLFPNGSPNRSTPGSAAPRSSARRLSMGGTAEGSIAAERHRRATLPLPASAEEPEAEAEAAGPEQPAAKNLEQRFEGAQESFAFEPEERTACDSQKSSKMKTPKVYWNNRNSTSGRVEQ